MRDTPDDRLPPRAHGSKSGANRFFYIRHPFDTQLSIPELRDDFERRGIGVTGLKRLRFPEPRMTIGKRVRGFR